MIAPILLLTLSSCARVFNQQPTSEDVGVSPFDLEHDSTCPLLAGYPGGYGLAWRQEDLAGDSRLYFSVLDATGKVKVPPFAVDSKDDQGDCPTQVLWTGSEFALLWLRTTSAWSATSRNHAAIKADGTTRLAPHKVSPARGFRAAWSGAEIGVLYYSGTPALVYFRRYDADLEPLGAALPLSDAAVTSNSIPRGICWTGSRWLATWTPNGTYAARLRSDGRVDVGPTRVPGASLPGATNLVSLGRHPLRVVRNPPEIFTLPPENAPNGP